MINTFLATVLHIISVTDQLFFTCSKMPHSTPAEYSPAKLATHCRLIHLNPLHTLALPPNCDAKCWAAQSKFRQNFHYKRDNTSLGSL